MDIALPRSAALRFFSACHHSCRLLCLFAFQAQPLLPATPPTGYYCFAALLLLAPRPAGIPAATFLKLCAL